MRKTYVALVGLLVAALAIAGAAPAQASTNKHSAASKYDLTVSIYHEAVSPIAVSGSGIGTVRTFFIPIAVNGKSADYQYLSATLTTVAEHVTPDGRELRSSSFAFVFGNEQDQVTVSGVALYAPSGATLPVGARVIRPITGGTGKYEGAVGQCISTNLGANGWTHVLKIFLPH